MFKSIFTMQQSALACSVVLHAGLLAWAAWPYTAAELPQQQIVDISVVMLSWPEPATKKTSPVQSAEELLQQAMDSLPPPPKHPQLTDALTHKQRSPPQQMLSTPPTTGVQAPNTVEKVAAVTDPLFNASYLHNTPPAYPDDARNNGIEGKVLLNVNVTPQGNAQEVSIRRSSGYTLLDYAAREAVKSWRFVPARHGDTFVDAKVVVPVEFKLE